MSLFVAIERVRSSLLVAVVEGGSPPRLRGFKEVPAPEASSGTGPGAGEAEAWGQALRAALPEVRWSRATVVAVLGDEAPLRGLQLPPAPPEETPDMVRLLATKELAAAEEDAIDYSLVAADDRETRVIAARAPAEAIAAAQQLAKRLDATLGSVVLRACASAFLATRQCPEAAAGARLVVVPASNGADLVALRDQRPVLIRSTRGADAAVMQADIRRTLPAASQQLGEPPRSIIAFGSAEERVTLETPVGEIPMQVVDLAALPAAGWAAAEAVPGPFVGVIGAALEAAAGERPAFDFLHPRRAESAAPARRRQLVLAGLAAASVVAAALMAYGKLTRLDQQIADLRSHASQIDAATDKLAPSQRRAERLEAWGETDIVWLDELDRLSRKLRPRPLSAKDYPAESDVFLTDLLFRPPTDGAGGGQVELKAAARSVSSLGALEARLRDDRHEAQPISVSGREGSGRYPWEFQTFLRVAPPAPQPEIGVPSSDAPGFGATPAEDRDTPAGPTPSAAGDETEGAE